MRNPDYFDPQQLARYTVIRVYFEYQNQPAEEKLFVVLRHFNGTRPRSLCLKATSKTQRFESDPDLLAGCVLYAYDELRCFPQRTVIAPESFIEIDHWYIDKQASKGRYRVEGRLPADFHGKLIAAIKNSIVLSPNEAKMLLEAIGEAGQ